MMDDATRVMKPIPPTAAYSRPSSHYIARLVVEMRDAHQRAHTAKTEFEKVKARLEGDARAEALSRGYSGSAAEAHVRGTFKNRPALDDLAAPYKFWREESDRLAALIQAEATAYHFIQRLESPQ
jgi:hypothetical protein